MFQVSQIISDNLNIHNKAKDTLLSKALAVNMHQEVLQSFSSDLRACPEQVLGCNDNEEDEDGSSVIMKAQSQIKNPLQ